MVGGSVLRACIASVGDSGADSEGDSEGVTTAGGGDNGPLAAAGRNQGRMGAVAVAEDGAVSVGVATGSGGDGVTIGATDDAVVAVEAGPSGVSATSVSVAAGGVSAAGSGGAFSSPSQRGQRSRAAAMATR